jgi:hypothetical protein
MPRVFVALLFSAVALWAANFKLYLTDGSFHLVREYQVEDDRVRFYSVERSEWEEVPVRLTDLKRTEAERQAHQETLRKDAAELAAEEKFEREQRQEAERVPQAPGVYLLDGPELKTIPLAETKCVTSKSRSVLKVLSPIPMVSGKATVEIDGEHAATVVSTNRPEFYIRLPAERLFGFVRLKPTRKGGRLVQTWITLPVVKELAEEQDDLETFRKQVDDGLYKIWPASPLEPGEYAVIEYTPGKGDIRTWDFAYRPK